ncbi:uncharacterized protein OCT59_011746 [Rhizophagus irregularis]|uniref:Ubiquitin-ribosomal 60S subunit protein L40B fusion protein n=1 Tax=Rhizophagus irregularis (strain DAOM 197198w) TaxID=1432141 RepID=A0A015JB09_RHIIW|nr:ubiquitin-ribosomal 60S subunit protein L40B fusion protein [Rhizophagus irregularis DAOM 197198w]UZO00624.1 hypothetical protein OCT59_011746 [Rhizophagus irregularis]GBC39385.1 ubiquitin domain-containing protein [Rhizophagus irregularis DAOM 181602=DAOM 197198]
MSNSLLAAALSAITNRSVITYDDYSKGGHDGCSQLDQKALHQSHLVGGRVPTSNVEGQIRIYIKESSGITIVLEVCPSDEIRQLKAKIEDKVRTSLENYLLKYGHYQLKDEHTLTSYRISHDSTIHLVPILIGGGDVSGRNVNYPSPSTMFIHPDSLAPSYDYDFTQIDDKGKTFMRGNVEYKRPCGWKRFAINVLNKYDNNIWLGVDRNSSTSSAQNEWPVSYHGTARDNCKLISEVGYDLLMGKRFLFGRGIYSTPDIDIAYRFATRFTHDGDNYKVVFQNRVNPNDLVKVSKEETGVGEYWISPKNDDLRPYGICIKKEN